MKKNLGIAYRSAANKFYELEMKEYGDETAGMAELCGTPVDEGAHQGMSILGRIREENSQNGHSYHPREGIPKILDTFGHIKKRISEDQSDVPEKALDYMDTVVSQLNKILE